jgi:hypothetical protein
VNVKIFDETQNFVEKAWSQSYQSVNTAVLRRKSLGSVELTPGVLHKGKIASELKQWLGLFHTIETISLITIIGNILLGLQGPYLKRG